MVHTENTGNNGGNAESKTRLAPQARELLNDQHNGLPIWIRPPKQGVEFYSGLSRTKLYELARKSLVRSVSIREPGQVKGTRLFNLASILAFIEKCEQGAAQKMKPANGASNHPAERGDTSFPLHTSRKRRRAETI